MLKHLTKATVTVLMHNPGVSAERSVFMFTQAATRADFAQPPSAVSCPKSAQHDDDQQDPAWI